MFHLKLLGGAVVEDEAGVVSGLSSLRHPLALLALLASAPSGTLSRGKLVGLLWPEAREKTARNRLTSCLYQVRRELGSRAVLSLGGDLRLDPERLTCDVWRFEEALEARDHRRAVELYGGPFLDGFWLRDSPEFEQWVDPQRARLRRSYQEALEALAREAEAQGELESAAGWWRERAAEDPYDTRVVRALMQALAATGNRAEALRVGREHLWRLEEDLGIEADAELRALLESLQAPPPVVPAARNGAAPTAAAAELPARAVAVLPFENLSGAEEAEPFAAGLHDDLLTELSRVSALTVISRTSVLGYRERRKPIREIARELGVGTVVEGAVQHAAGRVRLNVQLTDARDGGCRWAERYDRELTAENIFELQSELAGRITATLRAELTPRERERIARSPTENLDAYRLYAGGRTHLDQRTDYGLHRAVDCFQQAIEQDPEYGRAWAGLAEALALIRDYDYAPRGDAPDPMLVARRAVELAPDSGEAHASLGIMHALRHEGSAALAALRRALDLRPSDAEASMWLAWLHLMLGDPEQALAPAKRAAELNPHAPPVRVYLAEAHLANGELRSALEEAKRARQLQPEYGNAHFMEALVLYHLGRPAEASSILEDVAPLVRPRGVPARAEVRALLALSRVARGESAAARQLLEQVEEADHPFSAGLIHAALGEHGEAFRAFQSVRRWHSYSNEQLRYFFPEVLGPLRSDPRYRKLLREVDRSWEVERRPVGGRATLNG